MACNKKGKEENTVQILKSMPINDLMDLVRNEQYADALSPIEGYLDNGLYSLTGLILNEVSQRPECDALSLRIGLGKAHYILGTQNKERFSEAEKYIQNALNYCKEQEFSMSSSSEDSDVSDENEDSSDKSFSSDEGIGEIIPENFKDELLLGKYSQYRANNLLVALRILEGKLDLAYEKLKDKGIDIEIEDALLFLNALKSQAEYSTLSDDFISLFGKKALPEIFKFNKTQRIGDFPSAKAPLLKYTNEHKWFFELAMEKKLLDPQKYEKIITFCSSEKTEVENAEFCISKGQFEEAYEHLQNVRIYKDYDDGGFYEDSMFLLLDALKIQVENPILPNNLITLLGKKIFPEIFKFNEKRKKKLQKNVNKENFFLRDDIDEFKWFFKLAIEKKLLDLNVL